MMSKYFVFFSTRKSERIRRKITKLNITIESTPKNLYAEYFFIFSVSDPIRLRKKILLTPTQDKHANLSSCSVVFVGKCRLLGLWLGFFVKKLRWFKKIKKFCRKSWKIEEKCALTYTILTSHHGLLSLIYFRYGCRSKCVTIHKIYKIKAQTLWHFNAKKNSYVIIQK